MTSIYEDGTYLNKNPAWHEGDSWWKVKQILDLLNRNRLKPSTICEIGCGAGEILNLLHTEYAGSTALYGYDISPQAIEICKPKEKHNLQFRLANLLEEEGIYFDVALAIDVFEHVEDYLGFLRKFRKKGHYKLFHIPLDLSVQTILRASPITNARQSAGHIHYFTKETALAALSDTGYEVLDYFYTNSSLDLASAGWRSALRNLPRKILFPINQDLTVRILGGFSLIVLSK